jgi:integrase
MLVAAGLAGGRDHALISVLALNGLRVSEAIGANIGDLGLERGHRTLTIVRKGGKVVTVPLAPRTARAIDLAVGDRCDGPIFVAASGVRIDRHAAGRIVRRIARRAGLAKRVGPHTLRHAFITAALDAGVPLRDVQEAASHADPRTTMRYNRARVARSARHLHRRHVPRRRQPLNHLPALGQRDHSRAGNRSLLAECSGRGTSTRESATLNRRLGMLAVFETPHVLGHRWPPGPPHGSPIRCG